MSGTEQEAQQQQQQEGGGYIKTTTHNFVARNADIVGPRHVEIKGRSIIQGNVKIRGDLAIVRIGRYCEIDESTVVEPPPIHIVSPTPAGAGGDKKKKHVPVSIGSHTRIGRNCKIQAAAIGCGVWIGDDVQIGERCIIKDNCIVESGVILGNDTVVPPFTRVPKMVVTCGGGGGGGGGNNNNSHGPYDYKELPPSMAVQMQELSLDRFQEFRQAQRQQ